MLDYMQPARVLVIEDNESDIGLLRHALDQQGEKYELEILSDGEQALQFVHEHRTGVREPEPCVILLDLHLPLYDGMAILRAISPSPGVGTYSSRCTERTNKPFSSGRNRKLRGRV
jgi:CheY-like chemotaxis protein